MDIKRKLSPHLGDDLKIRIFFGEIQNFYPSSSSPPTSPLPINAPSNGHGKGEEGLELVAGNPSQGAYREVPTAEGL
jgi:hypothetical protein